MGEMVQGRAATRKASGSHAETADQQLSWVIAAQGGDRVAFNRLVLKWQQKIYNLSLRMLADRDEAAEATQDAFLSAFRGIGRFRLESQFSTWLYRIASNQCLSRLRKRKRVSHSLDEETEGVPLVERLRSPHDQEGDLLRGEQRKKVHKAIAALPSDQRIAVELKFFQERTFEEISSILDTPLSTVKSRFYSGLQGLKSRLTPSRKGTSRA